MYWLGLDVGTGGSRALLIDEKARVRSSCVSPHAEMQMQKPSWAEQDPNDWWSASKNAIGGVLKEAGINGDSITGIGLTGQMHGLVLLDSDFKVIRPALIWCDQRSQKQVDEINEELGPENILRATANPMLTGFTLPKLLWVRDNEPDLYGRIAHILLPKDFLRFQLTGDLATDVSDASGTGLLDVLHRRWSDEMIHGLDLNPSWLPKVFESSEITGAISQAAASVTGLRAGTPVVAGAGDQAASAVGNGIVEPGKVSCTIGSSGVVFAYLAQPAYDPAGRVHTFCHAIPNAWHVMGVTQGAGLSLQWYRNRFAQNSDYDELTADASLAPPGAHGLFFLPYLMGERTPHLDPNARGAWIGVDCQASIERSDPLHSGRSLLQPERRVANHRRPGCATLGHAAFGRRRAQSAVASIVRRCIRQPCDDARDARRLCIRRCSAGRRRHRSIYYGTRGRQTRSSRSRREGAESRVGGFLS